MLWIALVLAAAGDAPAAPPAPVAPADAPLDLANALRIGFAAHPQLAAAQAIADSRAEDASVPWGAFVPHLFADLRAFQQADPVVGANITLVMPRGKTTTEGVGGAIGLEGGSPFGLSYQLRYTDTALRTDSPLQPFSSQMLPTLSLRLTQNLWRGLLPSANLSAVDAAEARTDAAGADVIRAKRDVALRIAEGFIVAASDQAAVGLQERSLTYAQELEKLTRELIDAGKLSAIDHALPLQTVKARETEVSLARARSRLSQAQLATALMEETPSTWSRPISLEATAAWTPVVTSAEDAVQLALTRSPDLSFLRAQRAAIEANVAAADDAARPDIRVFLEGRVSGPTGATNCPSGYLPDGVTPCYVGQQFVGGYDRAFSNMAAHEYYGVSVGLSGSIPTLFSPWTAAARARRLDLASLDHEIEATERRIATEVRGLHADALARRQVVELADEAVKLAEQALKAEDTKLRAGRSTGFDVLRAQENVIAALVQQNAARTQAALSLVRLRALMLELDPEHALLYGASAAPAG